MPSVVLGFSLLLAAASATAFQQKELVTVAVVGPTQINRLPGVEVSVVNHSSDHVLAWEIDVRVKLTDGTTDHQRILRDRFGALSEPSPNEPLPAPGGGSVQEVFIVSLSQGVSIEFVTASMRCAVFADGSWVGNAARVDDIFKNRAREEAAQTVILEAIDSGRAVRGRAGLREALNVLNDPAQTDFDHLSKRAMRQNLLRALDNHPLIRVGPDEFLEWWFSRAQSQRDIAAASRQRRGPRR